MKEYMQDYLKAARHSGRDHKLWNDPLDSGAPDKQVQELLKKHRDVLTPAERAQAAVAFIEGYVEV